MEAGRRGHEQGPRPVLVAMCLGLMLSMFTSTQVNVALPAIAVSLHASPTGLQWVSAAYTLCYATMLLPGGALAPHLGRRGAFLAGVAVFTAGSLGCALAPTLGVLLAARVVQALGAAVLLPQTLAVLTHEYTDPTARSHAVGIWAGGASVGLAAGPVLGGLLIELGSWRWGFALSVVLGVAALALGARAVRTSRHGPEADAEPLDLLGMALSVLALAPLVYGLIESRNEGWTAPVILGCFVVSALGLAAFLRAEAVGGRGGRRPMLPLHLWRVRPFVGAVVAGFAYFFMFFAVLYFFSLYLQDERHLTALATGVVFLPMLVVMAFLGPVAGRLTARFGPPPVLVGGLLVGALGCVLLGTVAAHPGVADTGCRLLVVGVGSGLMSAPTSTLAVTSVGRRHTSTASAVHTTSRQIGSTLGVAVLGGVVGAAPTFASGLALAMRITAALLAATAVAVALLTRGRRAPV